LGGFIFPPLIQYLIDAFEWREGLRILAGFILVAIAPAIFFLVVNRPSDRNLFADGAAAPPEEAAHVKGSKPESARRILANPNFWFVALSLGIPMSAGAGMISNIVPFAADIGVATAEAALVLSTIAAMSLIGKLTFSVLGDRVDLRWIQAGSLIMQVLGLVTLACAHAAPLIFAGSALLSYGFGILSPLWGALIARVFGQEMAGRVMGFAMLVAMVLSMIAPVLIGAMRDASGSYVTAFLFYAALIGLAVLLLAKIRVAQKPPPALVVAT
jgi:cyanate permease